MTSMVVMQCEQIVKLVRECFCVPAPRYWNLLARSILKIRTWPLWHCELSHHVKGMDIRGGEEKYRTHPLRIQSLPKSHLVGAHVALGDMGEKKQLYSAEFIAVLKQVGQMFDVRGRPANADPVLVALGKNWGKM